MEKRFGVQWSQDIFEKIEQTLF